MRAYVMTTGTLFGILAIAHVLRIVQEGPALAKDPWYILITLAAAALCVWAWLLVWRSKPRS
jgi:hypothetical protein